MRVRWGIIGCGSVARGAIAPAIHASRSGDLKAVASRTVERAEEQARIVNAPKAYGSYEALLEDKEIDAVYIGLPNGEHTRWAQAAAKHKKHVLCDKSLALSVGDARTTTELFKSQKLRLVEGFMVRHHPQWSLLGNLLYGGTIGTVRHVRSWLRATIDSAENHRWSPTLGGGALFDVGCYPINAARFVFRSEPKRAQGTATWRVPDVDESVDAILEFEGGGVASIHGSLRAPFEQGLVVSGDRGRIIMDRPFVPHWDPVEVIVERVGQTDRFVHHLGGANHFLHFVEHVDACIQNPKRELTPAEDGLANTIACALVRDACKRT